MDPGVKLGDFILKEKIGEGSFGVVHRAHQEGLGRDAVVKVLHARHRENQAARGRFLREARLASRLDHPLAAHIYAFGAEPDGALWIAMELVRGTPLDAYLAAQGRLPLPLVTRLVEQIADVVNAAHEQGIVHRDLKPANVMVVTRGGELSPKLLDFGLARAVSAAPDGGDGAAAAGEAPADLRLTRAGAHLGSPLYMAPEQWRPDGVADARSDQYALAVVVFECLTGAPPFVGTLIEVGRAHVSRPFPSLGPGFPAGLDAVLARAAAKDRDARFPGVTAFAAALRSAAGLGGPEPLPPLPAPLRHAIVHAPQPVAEAIAALEAARNPHQALEAARVAGQALLRYTAAVALAGRTRQATGRVPEGLAALRRRAPDETEWPALIAELLQPWRASPDEFPIPELARLFAGGPAALGGMADLESSADAEVRGMLVAELDDLAARAQALAFLNEYPLVVPRPGDDACEVWMGPRRLQRALVVPAGARLTPGHPTLLDREGRPALDLWPIVQAAPPAPGAHDEMFLLAGPGVRGARLVASPLGVERQDPAVWDHLRATFAEEELGVAGAEEQPWRGLRPYTRADAGAFFGREEETQALANRLRVERFVAVAGPSGSGKSSLVQAGLLPALGEGARAVVVRPGLDPPAELAAAVARELGDGATLSGDVVLVIDQLEELFTLTTDENVRRAYAETLAAAARSARVVVTVRDDFLARANRLPALRDRFSSSLVLLGNPAPEDLERVILEPARRAGYGFDDPRLPAAMVAEVADRPGALALLSFTAARLWERRDRHFRQLLRKSYDDMGGVGGALARHAEETLEAVPAADRRRVREAFRQLTTAEGTRAVMARSELAPLTGEPVLERLIAARLLAASDDGRVEIAHEALLEAWPRLREWRLEDEEGARLRDQLRAAAHTWAERGRPRGLLWRDEALAEHRRWRARSDVPLPETEQAFVTASLREASRGRRRRLTLIAVAFAVLSVAAALLFLLARRAQRSAADAHARLLKSYEDQGRELMLSGDLLRGMAYLDAAYQNGADDPALHFLLARGLEALHAQRAVLSHGNFVTALLPLRDGARIVTTSRDGKLAVWDAEGKKLVEVAADPDTVWSAALSPDQTLVATAGFDHKAKVWRVADGSLVHAFGHDDRVKVVAFSPDGRTLASGGNDGRARLWDLASGAAQVVFVHGAKVEHMSFDGFRLVTGGTDGRVAVWDAATGALRYAFRVGGEGNEPVVALAQAGSRIAAARQTMVTVRDLDSGAVVADIPHPQAVTSVVFSPDGAQLATGSADGQARLWEAGTGKLRGELPNRVAVRSIRFCGNGSRIVTGNADGTAQVWTLPGGQPRATLFGHRNAVTEIACDDEGRLLATGSFDRTVRLWDARAAPARRLATGSGGVYWLDVSPDGGRAVTTGVDGRVVIWDIDSWKALVTLPRGEGTTAMAVFAPDADHVLVAEAGTHAARLWRVADGTVTAVRSFSVGAETVVHAEVSRDGARAVVSTAEGTVWVFDARTGQAKLQLRGHTGLVMTATFSPDGARVASGGRDRTARTWDAATGAPLLLIDKHQSWVLTVAYDAAGERLLTSGADAVGRVWNARTGELLASLEGHTSEISASTFDASGMLVASAGAGGDARIWDAASGRLLAILPAHRGVVDQAVFRRGRELLTCGQGDDAVAAWQVSLDAHSRQEVSAIAKCAIPFELVGETLASVSRDTACRWK